MEYSVAERRRGEEALYESEWRFRRLVESNIIGILLVDADGRIVEANHAFLKMMGYTRSHLQGTGLRLDTLTPAEYQPQDAWARDQLAAYGSYQPLEKEFLRPDGSRVPVLVGLVPLVKPEDLSVCLVIDVTQKRQALDALRKAYDELELRIQERTAELSNANTKLEREIQRRTLAEKELTRSNKELEQFAYVASHDLQEPLRKITSFTEILASRYQDRLDDNANKFIGYVVDAATRMQALIRDLLAYARTGGGEFIPERSDLSAVVAQVVSDFETTLHQEKAEVTVDPLPTMMTHPLQMKQLLQNLIGNALKFRSQEPPRVRVSVKKTGKEWVFSVSDNGIGMDPQEASHIFEIFKRLHTRTEYPGTGIGLAICEKIVARHGGRIWVESEPGKGSTFYFTLPAALSTGPWKVR